MNHVRIVRKRQGRAGYSARHFAAVSGTSLAVVNETLCGGEMTDRDILPRDAKRDMAKGWTIFIDGRPVLECEKCRSLVEMNERGR